ncbi:hypothetical protein KBD33_02015 [Candidatus Gracilibacteria bacterium]|nr:hypothetical protein [Candidatus Gracilibacteria bacterium]
MGYGDFAPPSGHHHKKPLTKAQIRKLQDAYSKAGEISDTVKSLEKEEQERIENEMENVMRNIL